MPLAHADSSGSISCAHTNISLDPSEFFTQMCSMAQLVKTGPRQGLFQSVVPVFENWFRLRREWLEETAAATSSKYPNGRLVWVESENIGLVVKVTRKGRVRPILMDAREEDRLPAIFEVQYHGGLCSFSLTFRLIPSQRFLYLHILNLIKRHLAT